MDHRTGDWVGSRGRVDVLPGTVCVAVIVGNFEKRPKRTIWLPQQPDAHVTIVDIAWVSHGLLGTDVIGRSGAVVIIEASTRLAVECNPHREGAADWQIHRTIELHITVVAQQSFRVSADFCTEYRIPRVDLYCAADRAKADEGTLRAF